MPETEMIGSSPAMVEIYKTASRVAPTDATVLIEGETGTGKELVARMIHRFSSRSSQPFVPVDCASISPSLVLDLLGAIPAQALTKATLAALEQARDQIAVLLALPAAALLIGAPLWRVLSQRRAAA